MPPTPLQAIEGVANACQALPNVVSGGQPTAANLHALKEAGVSLVLDLRDPMEPRPIDEPSLVRELGMEYVNVPVGSGSLSDATLAQILATLRSADGRTVFCHCAGGGRVGAAVLAYLMIDQGLDEETAVAQAMRVGLRSTEMMEWSLNYAYRLRPPPPARPAEGDGRD